jgi:hypothetical protein
VKKTIGIILGGALALALTAGCAFSPAAEAAEKIASAVSGAAGTARDAETALLTDPDASVTERDASGEYDVSGATALCFTTHPSGARLPYRTLMPPVAE